MSNLRTLATPIFFLALCTALGVWVFQHYFERYETTEDAGWTKEAHLNPWLAAKMLLEKSNQALDRYKRIEDLHPVLSHQSANNVIIINNIELILTRRRTNELLEWVERGGHLIVALPSAENGSNHPLLEHFGVSLVAIHHEDDNDEPEDSSSESYEKESYEKESYEKESYKEESYKEESNPGLTRIEFYDSDQIAEVHLSQNAQMDHKWFYLSAEEEPSYKKAAPEYWSDSALYGTTFMEFREGSGLITLLSSTDIWNNQHIDLHDHAWLLHKLLNGRSTHLLTNTDSPALIMVAWRAAPELVIAACLWLVFWLVFCGRRFGAIREQAFTKRRAIVEHIRACATFLWRSKHPQALLTPLQTAIHQRCQQLCLSWNRLSKEQQQQWLLDYYSLKDNSLKGSEQTVSPAQLASAMSNDKPNNEYELVDRVRTLQLIRDVLL